MKIADISEKHRRAFDVYLEKGLVKDINFSGRTYQVLVEDLETGEEVWPFLQFNEEGEVKDHFCSCDDAAGSPCCIHISVACLRIFNGHLDPLHLRFKESLWNQLCELYAFRQGFNVDILKKEGSGHYICESPTGKPLFFIQAKNEGSIKRLFLFAENRSMETEETSLKFSGLPQEEIAIWREGRPSLQLCYELSFWSDLAKWLMLLQDSGEEYEIDFRMAEDGAPNQIWIDFQDVSLAFYLSKANFPLIISSLSSVKSPLPVYNFNEEAIDKIFYDKRERKLHIKLREELLPMNDRSLEKSFSSLRKFRFGDWLYVEGSGFYFQGQHSLLNMSVVEACDIEEVIDEYLPIIERHLLGDKLYAVSILASYDIFFDASWNFHLKCYIHEMGDLQTPHAGYFGSWVYVEGDGFYKLENALFDSSEEIVPPSEVSKFVHQNRSWLNSQEGFHTHLSSVEDRLTYFLDKSGLNFESCVDISGEAFEGMDFGDWVYIKGQGFYTKMQERIGLPVRSDIKVPKEEISSFIEMNREDLHYVNGFFSKENPIIKAGLHISLEKNNEVLIAPEYDLLPSYKEKKLHFFENFLYVEGEGFSEIPVDTRLPKEFRHRTVIKGERIGLFLAYELDGLRKYAVYIDKRLSKGTLSNFIVERVLEEEAFEEKGWLTFEISYETEHGKILIADIWEALHSERRYLFSNAGLIDVEKECFQWLRQLGKSRVDFFSKRIKMTVLEFIRLTALESVEDPPEDLEGAFESQRILRQIRELRVDILPDFKGLRSDLRPYQKIGVDWLWFLYNHNLSGLLCDDMGLGKTHQAMALFSAARNLQKSRGKGDKYFLVVCPTSVIYHWQEKLERFLPSIRVCTFHGMGRSLDGFLCRYDLLLTSYGILRRERDVISLISFDIAIFDEVQVSKNHLSKLHSALLCIQSRTKIGLTGTPMENHLRELKALFDVVLPHYMPSERQYRDFFLVPIEKNRDEERKRVLQRFIRPFILRRKKEDVLQDLPEKTEEIAHCELTSSQMKLYREVLARSRRSLLLELSDENAPVPYMHIFSLLMKLKQVCNHPALALNDVDNYCNYSSGKWELFLEILNQARESGQKVVVFSQYLGMLDIIQKRLKETNVSYASLRGATVNRGKEIQTFQEDKNCHVFVASLLAAGLGIDLTAASVVIHYDRWWNAAKENQATDRVHRIGQTKGVQVFKLVTLSTLEEKIDEIISRKGLLMEEVVSSDGHAQLKKFSREELVELLQFVGEEEENPI